MHMKHRCKDPIVPGKLRRRYLGKMFYTERFVVFDVDVMFATNKKMPQKFFHVVRLISECPTA